MERSAAARDLRPAAKPEFERFRQRVRHMAGWDDHDYGLATAAPTSPSRPNRRPSSWASGVYRRPTSADGAKHHRAPLRPPGRTVQVLVLDGRWFRSPWAPTDQRDAPGKQRGRAPTRAAMLGDAQWQWLERACASRPTCGSSSRIR
jgi:alkaline phosphatase D